MEIQLFIPCFIDQLYPQTAFNTIKVLEKAGCIVHYNPQQTCCGQPAFNSGYWKEAEKLAVKFLHDFSGNLPVVTPSGSCSGYIQNHYQKVLKHNSEQTAQLNSLKIYEFSSFLVDILGVTQLGSVFPHKVTFHDSCSALRESHIKDQPRVLLEGVKGLELIEMNESDTCCGFGGTFAVKHGSISTALAEKKVINAMNAGVEYLVSTEASCLMNVNSYVSRHAKPLKGIHLADVLASGI